MDDGHPRVRFHYGTTSSLRATYREWRKFYHFEVYWLCDSTRGTAADPWCSVHTRHSQHFTHFEGKEDATDAGSRAGLKLLEGPKA